MIGVIFGGNSSEHDVSVLSGLQACRALTGAGHDVAALYWTKIGDWFRVDPASEGEAFLQGAPPGAAPLRLMPGEGFVAPSKLGRDKALDLEAAVNCCHGGPGEDGTLQAVLDLAGVRYTGPTQRGAALGMDKLAFAAVVSAAGLPSLPRAVLSADGPAPSFDGPYLVKPRFGGSSIGISLAEDLDTARVLIGSSGLLRAGAIVEPYRPDSVDINIAIRTWPQLELSAIEKPERRGGAAILDYRDKYVAGEGMAAAARECPAVLPAATADAIRTAARQVADLAQVRGIARLDFLLEGDTLYVNELNTIPGSLSWYLWVEPAIPFAQLLTDMVAEATSRDRRTTYWDASGADGMVLRSAGSIAAKLG